MKFFLSKVFFLSLFVALLITAGLLFFVVSYLGSFTHQDEKILVPNVIGKKVGELDELITEKGFEYIINDSIFDNKKPKGIVVDQSPSPEYFVKEGRTMYLTINARTRKKIQIKSDVVDLSLRAALTDLQSQGVKVILKPRPSTPVGVVLGLNYNGKKVIPNETWIIEGDEVELTYSSSSRPSVYYENYYGLTVKDAVSTVESKGFSAELVGTTGTICKTEADTMGAKVIKQLPEYKEGMMLRPGSPVILYFSCDSIAK